MATTLRDKLDNEEQRIKRLADDGDIPVHCADALLELGVALDGDKVRHTLRDVDGNVVEFTPQSVRNTLQNLRITAVDYDIDLTVTTAEEINDAMAAMHDDEGKSKVTVKHYQAAVKHFFRFHDTGVDPEDIDTFTAKSRPRHDETDLFTEAEIDALRRACGKTRSPVRNRALLELFIFSGQRLTALVTLRIKDVDLNPEHSDSAYIYLNDDYDAEFGGLKGALVRGRGRPIFGARKYVRDWIQYHPQGDDPESWLFVGAENHNMTDNGSHLSQRGAADILSRLAEIADIDKPVNPHNFRHYWATVLKRDYDIKGGFDTIRSLAGHVEGSNTLESIYAHIVEEDYQQMAKESLGYREETSRTPFTPNACPTCGELLKDGWRRCPNCEEVFGPTEEVVEAAKTTEENTTETALTEDLDADDRAALQALLEAVDDPAALAAKLADD